MKKASVTASSPKVRLKESHLLHWNPWPNRLLKFVRKVSLQRPTRPTNNWLPDSGKLRMKKQLATTSPNQQEQNPTSATTSRVSPDSNDSGVVVVQQNVSEESQPTADFKRGHTVESPGKETGKPVVGFTNPEGSSVFRKILLMSLLPEPTRQLLQSDEHPANDKQSVTEPETTVNATTQPEGLPEQTAQQSADERAVAIHQASEEQPKAETECNGEQAQGSGNFVGRAWLSSPAAHKESESRQQPTANQPSAGNSKMKSCSDNRDVATDILLQLTQRPFVPRMMLRNRYRWLSTQTVLRFPQTTQNTDRTRATTGTQTGSTDRAPHQPD